MAILRYRPGEVVPSEDTYALVGHYGEATDIALRLDEGDRFPLVTIAADFGALWYVRMDVANENPRAA